MSEQPKDIKEDSAEEMEAKADLLKAETALIEARLGFLDRLVMRGVIPIALIVAGPVTTYYFSQRADDGIEEVRKIGDSVEKLDEVIAGAKTAANKHDEARAAELIALRRIVSSLQWTIVVSQAREVANTRGRRLLDEAKAQGQPFDEARQYVEDSLYAHLAPRVDSDPRLLKEAIRGAVDELRPALDSLRPAPAPRFPAKGQ